MSSDDDLSIVYQGKQWSCRACESSSGDWKDMRRLAPHLNTGKHQRASERFQRLKQKGKQLGTSSQPTSIPLIAPIELGNVQEQFDAPFAADELEAATALPPALEAREPPLEEQMERYLMDSMLEGVMDAQSERFEEEGWDLGGDEQGTLSIQERMDRMYGDVRNSDWYPYPNRGMIMTDVLTHAPRLRFSQAQQAAIFNWARVLGASNVPSQTGLRAWEQLCLEMMGNPERRFVSLLGNVFYLNDLGHAISMDFSNPSIRPVMRFLPTLDGLALHEFWHGSLWRETISDEVLTATVSVGGRHWFTHELVQCHDGGFFIPLRWGLMGPNEEEHGAEGWVVSVESGELCVNDNVRHIRRADDFKFGYTDLAPQFVSKQLRWHPSSKQHGDAMPNPWRARGNGRMVLSVPIMVWADDVSGNVSKAWNKHICMCMSNLCLPRSALERESNIHFLGTSQFACPLELMEGLVRMIEDINIGGYEVFDAETKMPVLVRVWLAVLAGDNPLQAELCSHKGMHANLFCRRCYVGGTTAYKREAKGYAELFEPGVPRSKQQTINNIRELMDMAVVPNRQTASNLYASAHGIRDTIAEATISKLQSLGRTLRTKTTNSDAMIRSKLKDAWYEIGGPFAMNPLLRLNHLDVHMATPVEILHTFLLGIVKYLWGALVEYLDVKAAKVPDRPAPPLAGGGLALLEMRLAALDEAGWRLQKLNPAYIIQHRRQLNGKHFKTLAQSVQFVIEDLVAPPVLEAWVLVGLLGTMLWSYDIEDKTQFEADLRPLVCALIHAVARVDPVKMLSKTKLHATTHAVDDIMRLGPAVLFSTERYESFNSVFRMCSVLSNRQAPSRDIARCFAQFERVRHILSGGFWKDPHSHTWRQAGAETRKVLATIKSVADLLGLKPDATSHPHITGKEGGMSPCRWADTETYRFAGPGTWNPDVMLAFGGSMVTLNGDHAPLMSFVVWRDVGGSAKLRLGRICRLLKPIDHNGNDPGMVELQVYLVGEDHPTLVCPQLIATKTRCLLSVRGVLACVNVQHDCSLGGWCPGREERSQQQERESTSQYTTRVQHRANDAYLLNIFSFHNSALIRQLHGRKHQTPLFSADAAELRRDLAQRLGQSTLAK